MNTFKLCLLAFLLPEIIFKQWDNLNTESIKKNLRNIQKNENVRPWLT